MISGHVCCRATSPRRLRHGQICKATRSGMWKETAVFPRQNVVSFLSRLLPTPLLQSMAVACERHTQRMWKGNAPKWRIDMQATCDAKVEHFEKLTVILARHGQQSTQEMMRAALESKALPLFKAIQDITCQAANIPLTQATKWACDSWASRSTYLMVHCQSSSLQTLHIYIYTHR